VDPGPFFYIHITIYYLQALFSFLQTTIFYHTIRLIFVYSKPVRLTTSLLVGAKYFGCVVYRFHVAVGAELLLDRCHKQIVWSVAKSASINLQKWFLSPTGSIKPWFHTKGNLPLCLSYLPLGVPNWAAKHCQSDLQARGGRILPGSPCHPLGTRMGDARRKSSATDLQNTSLPR
jgi:hypothetical protein